MKVVKLFKKVITNTDNDQLNFRKLSGSGEIRTHDLPVTNPRLYHLRYRALGAMRE